MGGLGSGGHNWSGRAKVENSLRLDVSEFAREGLLIGATPESFIRGAITWSRRDRSTEAVSFLAWRHELVLLALEHRPGGPDGQDRRYRAAVDWVSCRFGGERPYFICQVCARRVLHLYLKADLACRRCHHLRYGSQNERAHDRAARAANKLRERLGGRPGALNPLPRKPRGMRWKTYAAIISEIERREAFVLEAVVGRISTSRIRLRPR